MKQDEPMQILLAAGDTVPVDQAFAALREQGQALALRRVQGEAEWRDSLALRPWDLAVCFEGARPSPLNLLALFRELSPELPLIVVLPEGSGGEEVIEAGAADALPQGQWKRFARVCIREVERLRVKRQAAGLEHSLRELEDRHRSLLEHSSAAFSYVQDGMHLYCNQAYAAFFGYPDAAAISDIPLLDLVDPEDRRELKVLLASHPRGERRLRVQGLCRDGGRREINLGFSPLQYQGRETLLLAVTPASGNRDYARQLEEIENHDLLTRLPNRARFLQALEEAIRNAIAGGSGGSLLVVELGGFTSAEQSLGRARANRVLAEVGNFLRESIKKDFLPARLDEHEFGLLLGGGTEEAQALADFIRGRIGKHLSSASGLSLELECSVGVAAINAHSQDAASLLARARANCDARHDGEGYRFRLGDTLQPGIADVVGYLEEALEEGRFHLVFQPIVDLKGQGPGGYEVLCRLLDSDGNHVPPSAFVAAADLHGLGETLDRKVVGRVLELVARSGAAGKRLVINLTRNTICGRTFLPWLSEALAAQGTAVEKLAFQISEIDLCRTPEEAGRFCQGLRELGLARVLTHFGGSLDPFAQLPLVAPDHVVLDESLLRNIAYSQEEKRRLRTMVDQLHKNSYPVAAPRVEDLAFLPLLWEVGIDLAQGYCLQAPSQEMDYEFIQEQEITLAAIQPR